MFDFEVAFFLYKISRILAIYEDNKFKSEAFFKAAMAIDAYDKHVEFLVAQNRLTEISGIGKSSEKLIKEIIQTGRCKYLEELEKKYEIKDYSLILAHGLRNRFIRQLFYTKKITTFEELKKIEIHSGIPGESPLEAFINDYSSTYGKYLFSYAYCLGNELVEFLNNALGKRVVRLDLSAWHDKVDSARIDCLPSYKDKIKESIKNNQRYADVYEKDGKILCRTRFGLPLEIVFVNKIDEKPPKFTLRSDLHTHTTWSDGKHGIEAMYDTAQKLGREYIGITDHSYSLKVANGISEVDAIKQIEEIQSLQNSGKKILKGIEVEILKDGSLDFSDAVLSRFDYVIAGIHSNLNQNPFELDARITKALSNPYVNIFAHPTSKLLGRPGVLFSDRKQYSININRIIEICKKNKVALEFNCFPERFDLGVEYFDKVLNSNVPLSVGTDSHSAAHLNCLKYAEIALEKYPELQNRVINNFSYEEIQQFFKKGRNEKRNDYRDANSLVTKATKDFWHFFSSLEGIVSGKDMFVGIDLTGSESKPSGWAIIKANIAETATLLTDDEIVDKTIKSNPTIISIDSPLSYPVGRCCDKKNCECKKFGIMRYCELLLRHFGIGVYPCLIDNMVDLTNRGIRLARRFRELGYNVIESYPGVAQDILSIKRKQNGIVHLINGYKSFGIVGEYLDKQDLKHDELDAIASALVGLFYVSDQYVALGNEVEDYLIVPSVVDKPQKPIVIGLTGIISAGKTTLAEYLKFKHGFKSFRYSQIIRDIYGCSDDRGDLQMVGSEIAEDSQKQKELSLCIIERIENKPDCNYVVDGLRHPEDYDVLKAHFGDRFYLIYLGTTFSNAYKRYIDRNDKEMSKEEFQKILNNEAERDIFQFLFAPGRILLENKKTFKDFFETFEDIYKEITKCR